VYSPFDQRRPCNNALASRPLVRLVCASPRKLCRVFSGKNRQEIRLYFNFGQKGNDTLTGTDVMIFKNILPKKSAKKWAFLTQNKAKLFNNLIITLVFEKNTILLAKS
jgi:hypothetical protein